MSKIIETPIIQTYKRDATIYKLSVNFDRVTPDYRDGLIPSQRRLLYAIAAEMNRNKFIKTQSVIGKTMEKFHPHGNQGLESAVANAMAEFKTNYPLFEGIGNWGNSQGDEEAAPRYTEMNISEFSNDVFFKDWDVSKNIVDYVDTYTKDDKEPEAFASRFPSLLVNGTFGIGYGLQVYIPAHNLNEVADAVLALCDNPQQTVVLRPDQLLGSDIIETDFAQISDSGFGNFKARAKIDIVTDEKTQKTYLVIKSTPDLTSLNNIFEKIVDLIDVKKKLQVVEYKDNSSEVDIDLWLELRKGADPHFNRELLYKHTDLQKTYAVNMHLLDGLSLARYNYTEYLLKWMDFRINTKYRMYYNRLQRLSTNFIRRDAFIKVMDSGDIDDIIKRIRSRNQDNEMELIEDLIKKYKLTELQAYYIINTTLKGLNKATLGKYKVEQKSIQAEMKRIRNLLDNEHLMVEDMKREIIEIKQKYGRPRRSKVISERNVNQVRGGNFNIIISKNNFVKKIMAEANTVGSFNNNDGPKLITTIDNRDNLVLFCKNGSLFSIPVNDIPMMDPNNTGIDLRFISKNLTSDVLLTTSAELLLKASKQSKEHYIVILTASGMIKRVLVKDFINVSKAGMYMVALENSDYVVDIRLASKTDMVFMFDRTRGLCVDIEQLPKQKRHARGARSMANSTEMKGLCITNKKRTKGVLVITNKGYINKLDIESIKHGKRSNAGASFIKLNDGDEIFKIVSYCDENQIVSVSTNQGEITFPIHELKTGSSISKGKKLLPVKGTVLMDCIILG